MMFPIALGAVAAPALLIFAHILHRQMCRRLGREPQRFPYFLAALPPLILLAAIVASAMSAGTAETRSGSGLQPASAVGNAETPNDHRDSRHD